eukprot:Blabericola_migrator_1__6112@NODE_3086_length_2050_cov_15_084216_g1932_i0_p2_GENE_NODE_3086_length_2050_cov_15_084216_g1932_i0NODE_3086_length_2050_cov_15_084216_g1932_i0_p2_ORF_typecomplete_len215_score35_29_NODE_3086_length_2050_cov_15_084216_g1932_i05301174
MFEKIRRKLKLLPGFCGLKYFFQVCECECEGLHMTYLVASKGLSFLKSVWGESRVSTPPTRQSRNSTAVRSTSSKSVEVEDLKDWIAVPEKSLLHRYLGTALSGHKAEGTDEVSTKLSLMPLLDLSQLTDKLMDSMMVTTLEIMLPEEIRKRYLRLDFKDRMISEETSASHFAIPVVETSFRAVGLLLVKSSVCGQINALQVPHKNSTGPQISL